MYSMRKTCLHDLCNVGVFRNRVSSATRAIATYVSSIWIFWYLDSSWCSTDFTFNEKLWPGHSSSEISLNQPFWIVSMMSPMVLMLIGSLSNSVWTLAGWHWLEVLVR